MISSPSLTGYLKELHSFGSATVLKFRPDRCSRRLLAHTPPTSDAKMRPAGRGTGRFRPFPKDHQNTSWRPTAQESANNQKTGSVDNGLYLPVRSVARCMAVFPEAGIGQSRSILAPQVTAVRTLAAVRFGCSNSTRSRGMTDVEGGKRSFDTAACCGLDPPPFSKRVTSTLGGRVPFQRFPRLALHRHRKPPTAAWWDQLQRLMPKRRGSQPGSFGRRPNAMRKVKGAAIRMNRMRPT